MLAWKTAFLVLLLAFPRFSLAEDEEAASDEPPMDDEPEEHEDGMPPPGPPEEVTSEQLHKIHAKMDADANGKLSLDEMLQFVHDTRKSEAVKSGKELLEGSDANKDGKVSLDELIKDMYGEYEQALDEQINKDALNVHIENDGKKFKAADLDNDGLLDELELSAFFSPETHDHVLQVVTEIALEEKDSDKDGLLTFDEFSLTNAPYGTAEQSHIDGEKEQFNKLDKDGSGKLDVNEFKAWESQHIFTTWHLGNFLTLADTDSDHHITIEELKDAHEKDSEEHNEAKSYIMEMVQHHEL